MNRRMRGLAGIVAGASALAGLGCAELNNIYNKLDPHISTSHGNAAGIIGFGMEAGGSAQGNNALAATGDYLGRASEYSRGNVEQNVTVNNFENDKSMGQLDSCLGYTAEAILANRIIDVDGDGVLDRIGSKPEGYSFGRNEHISYGLHVEGYNKPGTVLIYCVERKEPSGDWREVQRDSFKFEAGMFGDFLAMNDGLTGIAPGEYQIKWNISGDITGTGRKRTSDITQSFSVSEN